MVERKNAYSLIRYVKRKIADGVLKEQVKQLKPHSDNALTITQDNGKEFAKHEKLPEELEHAVDRLNYRPRKSLNYRTPHETYFGTYFGTTESLTIALGT